MQAGKATGKPIMHPHTFADLDALLFDMDGTLLNSHTATERCWRRWGERVGIDAAKILPVCHGRRASDTIGLLAPNLNVAQESAWMLQAELQDEGVVALPGVHDFLRQLPHNKWAIVTSAARSLAEYRLRVCNLPMPSHLISAEDVAEGKPHPQGYLLGAKRLFAQPARVLVFEDTAVGIEAGSRAKMQTLAILSLHGQLPEGAQYGVEDYRSLRLTTQPKLQVQIVDKPDA